MIEGFYKLTIGGAGGEHFGCVAIVNNIVAGTDMRMNIFFKGNYRYAENQTIEGFVRATNESKVEANLVMGPSLQPGKSVEFPFFVSKKDLDYDLTFRTLLGPIVLRLELIHSL